jgi:hypothetical protein
MVILGTKLYHLMQRIIIIFFNVRPDGLGSIGIHVEQSGGRKQILRQPSNRLVVKKNLKNMFLNDL